MQPEQRTNGRGRRRWQRVLLAPLVLLAALVFALEDWLWDPLTRLVSGLMRLPALRRVDVAVRSLPPYAALAALLTPALVLLPLKVVGLALFARGHAGLGVGVFAEGVDVDLRMAYATGERNGQAGISLIISAMYFCSASVMPYFS